MAASHLYHAICHVLLLTFALQVSATYEKPRYIMYLTGQHVVVPDPPLVENLTHVALAFMRPNLFNNANQTTWPMYTTVSEQRPKFAASTKIMVAIGGWGDTEGFETGAKTEESRALFAKNIGNMVVDTGADGVDIDWEYPGGNGEDYKTVPNSEKAWQIEAYPKLLSQIRSAIGPSKVLSAAVPGLTRDMLAFTPTTIPSIMQSLDFLNTMTYDLANRRDNVTKHHTGVKLSIEALDAYHSAGVPYEKQNLGFAFYVRWFKTDPSANCTVQPIGCKTALGEDPTTGADLGQAGMFAWHDTPPADLAPSFDRALKYGTYDSIGGGHYYFDASENRFWTWDTPGAILKKFPEIVEKKGLGGVFAWGLGEDANEFRHYKATNLGVAGLLEKVSRANAGRSEL